MVLAAIKHSYDWDWSGAGQAYRRALKLNPSHATAHQWYNIYLRTMGRFDDALSEARRAQELDPLSLIINHAVGETLYIAREYQQAIDQFLKTLDLDRIPRRSRDVGHHLAPGHGHTGRQRTPGPGHCP